MCWVDLKDDNLQISMGYLRSVITVWLQLGCG